MQDRTIPYYNVIMKCSGYGFEKTELPEGYRIVSYRQGFEHDWARMECDVGDFAEEEEAVRYFSDAFLNVGRDENILFLLDGAGNVTGSCIAWINERDGSPVNSLRWLVVEEAHQGKGLGRALCREVMNRSYLYDRKPIYLHTQPWSWRAILLYISLGFKLQKTDTFEAYENQYHEAMAALKDVVYDPLYLKMIRASED